MIPYRPVAPLTVGPRKGWKSVLAAVVMAALLGTTATAAGAAEPATQPSSVQSVTTAAPDLQAIEPAHRES
jgi:hypothetical protein